MSLLHVIVRKAHIGRRSQQSSHTNIYVTLKLQHVKSSTTTAKGPEPSWEQEFIFEINSLYTGLLIEVWDKGMLWDKAIGYSWSPLQILKCSTVEPGGKWLSLDADVVVENGQIVCTRNKTGHSLLVDYRFEMPCDYSTEDSYEVQRKFEHLNHIMLQATEAPYVFNDVVGQRGLQSSQSGYPREDRLYSDPYLSFGCGRGPDLQNTAILKSPANYPVNYPGVGDSNGSLLQDSNPFPQHQRQYYGASQLQLQLKSPQPAHQIQVLRKHTDQANCLNPGKPGEPISSTSPVQPHQANCLPSKEQLAKQQSDGHGLNPQQQQHPNSHLNGVTDWNGSESENCYDEEYDYGLDGWYQDEFGEWHQDPAYAQHFLENLSYHYQHNQENDQRHHPHHHPQLNNETSTAKRIGGAPEDASTAEVSSRNLTNSLASKKSPAGEPRVLLLPGQGLAKTGDPAVPDQGGLALTPYTGVNAKSPLRNNSTAISPTPASGTGSSIHALNRKNDHLTTAADSATNSAKSATAAATTKSATAATTKSATAGTSQDYILPKGNNNCGNGTGTQLQQQQQQEKRMGTEMEQQLQYDGSATATGLDPGYDSSYYEEGTWYQDENGDWYQQNPEVDDDGGGYDDPSTGAVAAAPTSSASAGAAAANHVQQVLPDNYEEGWYQDENGDWYNTFDWVEDENGEWYYNDRSAAAAGTFNDEANEANDDGWVVQPDGKTRDALQQQQQHQAEVKQGQKANGSVVNLSNGGATTASAAIEAEVTVARPSAKAVFKGITLFGGGLLASAKNAANNAVVAAAAEAVEVEAKLEAMSRLQADDPVLEENNNKNNNSGSSNSSGEQKLPPRPADYDLYYYQDEEGNWKNEYDDYGYEFDPDRYDGDDVDKEGPAPPQSLELPTKPDGGCYPPPLTGASRSGLKCSSGGSLQSPLAQATGGESSSRSSTLDRKKLTIDLSGTAPTKKVKKLPPRPADYDDYWYQDEDGNWRNEYDDEGYEFADDVYDLDDEERSQQQQTLLEVAASSTAGNGDCGTAPATDPGVADPGATDPEPDKAICEQDGRDPSEVVASGPGKDLLQAPTIDSHQGHGRGDLVAPFGDLQAAEGLQTLDTIAEQSETREEDDEPVDHEEGHKKGSGPSFPLGDQQGREPHYGQQDDYYEYYGDGYNAEGYYDEETGEWIPFDVYDDPTMSVGKKRWIWAFNKIVQIAEVSRRFHDYGHEQSTGMGALDPYPEPAQEAAAPAEPVPCQPPQPPEATPAGLTGQGSEPRPDDIKAVADEATKAAQEAARAAAEASQSLMKGLSSLGGGFGFGSLGPQSSSSQQKSTGFSLGGFGFGGLTAATPAPPKKPEEAAKKKTPPVKGQPPPDAVVKGSLKLDQPQPEPLPYDPSKPFTSGLTAKQRWFWAFRMIQQVINAYLYTIIKRNES